MGIVAPITGRKSGDEGHTPVESPNDLLSTSYAKMLLALGEGEWEGSIDGSMIYFNGTPLLDSEGNENFPGTKWDFRPGSVQQTYIQGIPSVENEITVNTELKDSNDWVRWFTNSMLSAVRIRLRWPALQKQKENGDIVGHSISYAIDIATDGGGYEMVLLTAAQGKTNTTYERSHRIDLPKGSSWQLRVRRLTPNQNKSTVSDTMFISAITEVVDAKFTYPNTALLYVEFDASQFNNIPTVAVKTKMRLVRVPTNYDPIARTYSGMWDGSFKIAWTNNPAWISYDIILEDRFGTGQRITANLVDKWELYLIAQYCDELVPDGKGGSEPRYLCDIYIQEAKEAWQVLRDLAAIYRGMTYWANGQMYTVADMPRDMDFIYTNANVLGGEFNYTGTSVRSKYTRALVSWDNPENEYNTDVTSVGDVALQRRYGDNPVELSAIGCTRESEGQRRGKWAIYTNNNDRMVSFSVGLDGQVPLPGRVIGIADRLIAGKRIGGRISAVDGVKITLDKVPADVAINDRLMVNLPSGKAEGRTITGINGNEVTVSTEYSETPAEQLQWAVESASLVPQLFMVMTVRKADSDEIEYQISAIEYNPSKFPAIDNGSQLLDRPISTLPPKTQVPPASVTISQRTYIEQAQSVTVMVIEWSKAENAVGYDVEWRKDDGEWVTIPRTGATSIEVAGVYSGNYVARVRAVNSVNVSSVPRESILTAITGKQGQLDTVNSMTTTSKVFGIQIDWTFPPASGDTLNTEIRYSLNADGSNPVILGQFAYPLNTHTMAGLAAGAAYFFSARLVDKSGNVSEWSDWVLGQSSSNADEILGYLTNQISESQLAQELLDPIQQIPSIKANADQVPGINLQIDEIELITNQVPSIQIQVDQVQSQLADIVGAGDWDNATPYNQDDLVKYNGALYRAITAVPAGTVPTNTSYWDKIGDYSSLGEFVTALSIRVDDVETSIDGITGELTSQAQSIDGIYAQVNPPMAGATDWLAGNNSVFAAAWSERYARASGDDALSKRIDVVLASVNGNAAAIKNESVARVDADEALAQDIVTLSASMNSNAAAIQFEATVRADADSALSQQITTLQADVDGNTSAIQSEATARASADSALSQQITTLQADVDGNTSAIQSEATTRASADSALSQQITTLQADVDGNTSAIQSEATTRASADSALSQQITTLQADVDGNTSAIQSEATTRASADSALSQQITTLQADVDGNTSAIQSEATTRASADSALSQQITTLQADVDGNTSAIQSESTARASADSALSQQIDTVQATADGNTTAVQQTSLALSDLDGNLQAMWKVSLGVTQDGKYYAAGFGVSYENSDQGLQSNFYVLADRFAILNKATGTTTITTPFVVENGQVFMNSAFIGELQNKTVIQRVGGALQVFGIGFGSNNQFMSWYGPDVGDISNCTEANATSYRKVDGSAYYGGALSAGVLKTGVTNPDKNFYVINSYPVEIGPYSHNGNPKNIVVSFALNASYSSSNPVSDPTQPSVGWRLERKIGSGDWTPVSNGTFHGTTTVTYDKELNRYETEEWCSSSSTFIDTYSGEDDLSYRVKILSFSRFHATSNVISQRLSLVSTEE